MLRLLLRLVRLIVRELLGRVVWQPPPWVGAAVRRWLALLAHALALSEWARAFKLRATLIAVTLLSFAGGGLAGCEWLAHRPKPVLVQLRVTSPGLTRIEETPRPDAIDVIFSASAARLSEIDKPVTTGITLTPPIAGDWRWIRDNDLHFQPSVDWPIDQEFVVSLDPRMFPSHVHLATFEARFRTPPFSMSLSDTEFYQDPTDPKVKQVVTTVHFSHPVAAGALEQHVAMLMTGRKEPLRFTVSYDKLRSEAYVHSETIDIPSKDAAVTMTIAKGVKAERGGNEAPAMSTSVTVPGLLDLFRVESAQPVVVDNERFEPQQIVVVQTTASVNEKDIAKKVKLVLLPEDLPSIDGQPAQEGESWGEYGVTRLDARIFALSTSLTATMLPAQHEASQQFSFVYRAPVGRWVYLRIPKGLASFGGYLLAEDYETVFQVPPIPEALRVLHDGAILSLKGEKKLSIMSRGLDGLRFDVGLVLPDRVNNLVSQTQGDFRHPVFGYRSQYGDGGEEGDGDGGYEGSSGGYDPWRAGSAFNQYDLTEQHSETRPVIRDPSDGKPQFTAFDLGPLVAQGKRGLFFFKVSKWVPGTGVVEQPVDSRFVVVTDLGLLVKDDASGEHDVFVESIHDGKPVGGATVDLLGRNGIPIATATTDAQGHAKVPNVSGFTMEKAPTAYVVRTTDDLSFLPFSPHDRALDVSRFDVGGVQGRLAEQGLSAYLFSDRGLYRPGDEIHLGMIVKHPDWSSSLAGVPIEIAVRDARGVEVEAKKMALSSSGFEEISTKTEDTSPTGTWEIDVYLARDGRRDALLGSAKVRVEEFLPDRLRIRTAFSDETPEGWIHPEDLTALVHLENLFGTAAESRNVTGAISLSPAYPAFGTWKDYTFFDPLGVTGTARPHDEELAAQTTDENGDASFPLGLEKLEKATYELSFVATGFEAEGGRGVTGASTALVSPLDHLLGFKADGSLSWIPQGSTRMVDVIAVDPHLARVALPRLTEELVEERYVSTLMKQKNGTYRYESIRKDVTDESKAFAVGDKGTSFKLPTSKGGDFVLRLVDADGTELLRIPFTVAGQGNVTRDLERNAELQLKLSKSDYLPGDEIEMEIRAPYTGTGLITIERDRVYAWQWFQATTTTTTQKIKLPADLEGNGYVSVSFLRAPDSPEIFMSPLSYGVAPFSISKSSREDRITLDAADLARPGEPFTVTYRASEPSRIVVFGIDEGILQVAGYQTPDPLDFYFRKRALEVRTLQILDLVLPEFSLSQSLAGQGGDQENAAVARNLNPFKRKQDKPVAFWSGIVDAGPDAKSIVWNVPDSFNGTLRVMAVAVGERTMGAATKPVTVRGPFVLSPNLPTTVAPGDRFLASVGIANQAQGSGKGARVSISVKVGGPLVIVGGATQEVPISEGHEGVAMVTLQATNDVGPATVTFVASGAGKQATREIGLSVRPAIPYMTDVESGSFSKGTIDAPVPRTMLPEFRKLEVSASPLPLALGPGLVRYLVDYPYGCTEQVVSKAFPALVLRDKPELGYDAQTIDDNLAHAIETLRSRQNAEGAFGFWAANSHVDDFQVVYATHFLTEAKDHGVAVPPELLSRALGYVGSSIVGREVTSLSEARLQAYALYVMARNGLPVGAKLTALRQSIENKRSPAAIGWKLDATAAWLAGTHAILKQDKQANEIAGNLDVAQRIAPDYGWYYDSLSRNAQVLYVLSRHFPERVKKVTPDELSELVDPVLHGSFNTLSSSYALLALATYTDVVGPHASTDMAIDELLPSGDDVPVVLPKGLFPHVEFSDRAAKIRFKRKEPLATFWQVTMAGFDAALPTRPIVQHLEVTRDFRVDGSTAAIDSTTLGSEIEVHLHVRAVGGGGEPNIAVVDLLPGGFEVVMNEPGAQASEPPDGESARAHAVEDDGGGDGNGEGEGGDGESAPAPAPEKSVESGSDSYWSSTIAQPGSTWTPEYVDVREDRVLLFGAASSNAEEIVYKIRATNRGRFVVPPPFAESMYDRDVRARGLSGTMEVK